MQAEVKFIQRRSHTREIDSSVIMPQVSINGTSKGELIDQQQKVVDALSEAAALMRAAMPHGRDFQYDPQAGIEAREDAMNEIATVQTLIDRHNLIIGHLVDG
jgi:hypothetical protein